jgi:hypothetical protein
MNKNIDTVKKKEKRYVQLQKITKKSSSEGSEGKKGCPVSLKKEKYVFYRE